MLLFFMICVSLCLTKLLFKKKDQNYLVDLFCVCDSSWILNLCGEEMMGFGFRAFCNIYIHLFIYLFIFV